MNDNFVPSEPDNGDSEARGVINLADIDTENNAANLGLAVGRPRASMKTKKMKKMKL